ncbi:histidinol dehydrogenase 1 [Acetobacter pasteurianus]|uniref:Histidinol dehydrogenase n=4 Tax=Acetobacter pasteurianus TaxID=438 RepID=A0A401WV89_ACEPA|nr:histidinol dehydrogenase [Acetobacter pasteurianus]ASC06308.1 Histidinol dehydrogenase [Acetobacter pasteurianus subsp. pasteurianus]BAI00112.1 histidinol dehydrogenase [Acetobacter pasteurianus IFO 3283-01]BAI03165.1 histidinol dehydrogenase [Acetobacter pasteurianus IFO 3283-03]BAI06210.1 histidinol dehydrogenase [Acetobacter pasteurianus IFO 3283-07]BAI09260.1 histidinol dehydrogenase [Acetobacter pasteurianus IFO 3283-22]
MKRLDTREPNFETDFTALLSNREEQGQEVHKPVADILAAVRKEGDAALCAFTERFDRLPLTAEQLAFTAEEIEQARAKVSPELLEALDVAAQRIESFHKNQLPADIRYTDDVGMTLGLRWIPLDAVGLYVPGGKAAYPSSVLMNAIPAKVAGVKRLAMCVPTPDGVINPLVLAAAHRAGVTEIYRVGGAQAVGAMAYGTQTIRPVDRIVGPGNAYVAEAKRQVFGYVGIDSIAGPSDVVVIADSNTNPRLIALDLLAQAEHDECAQATLITPDAAFADTVIEAVEAELRVLSRAAIAGASWARNGAVLICRDMQEAVELANRLAPEHLELMVDDPESLFAHVRHAGAAFLGRFCPEAIGDYVGGPNHVLPTSRTARFASGLSVFDFMKRTTFLSGGPDALRQIGPAAVALAQAEGLEAHALSVSARLDMLAASTPNA